MSDRLEILDKNFQVPAPEVSKGVIYYSAFAEPFKTYGLMYEEGCYRRMPKKVAQTVSEGVKNLHVKCSGGRIRFCTDSSFIKIRASMHCISKMPHFSLAGSAGFDVYADARHVRCLVPPEDMQTGYESQYALPEGMHLITIWFPLYAGVKSLQIGLENGCCLEMASDYPNEKPVVFYGSSITQGACASRAGNSYVNMLSRMLNLDIWNLGFSGNALAEDAIAQYIAQLPMDCFVYDYDHNSPDVAYLARTHERMFQIIRHKQPSLPVIFMGRPKFHLTEEETKKLEIIRTTYERALAAGDHNVYLVTGPELMAMAQSDGTVDSCHPNDLGFGSMARALEPILQSIFSKEEII